MEYKWREDGTSKVPSSLCVFVIFLTAAEKRAYQINKECRSAVLER